MLPKYTHPSQPGNAAVSESSPPGPESLSPAMKETVGDGTAQSISGVAAAGEVGSSRGGCSAASHLEPALNHKYYRPERHQPPIHRCREQRRAAALKVILLRPRSLCAWLPAATAVANEAHSPPLLCHRLGLLRYREQSPDCIDHNVRLFLQVRSCIIDNSKL